MKPIQSSANPHYKQLLQLQKSARARKKLELYTCEGWPLLHSLLASRSHIEQVWLSSEHDHAQLQAQLGQKQISCYVLPQNLFNQASTLEHPSGPIAVFKPAAPENQATSDMLVLDQIQDPGNLGTILRSAAAAGVLDIRLSRGCVSAWAPKTLRAGMGAQFSLHIFEQIDEPELLPLSGYSLFSASSHAAKSIYETDLSAPICWVFGNEGSGVSPGLLAKTTGVRIPQPGGQESLNVAVANSICLFEMCRQRQA